MILTIFIVLIVLALLGGSWGSTRGWGYYGWSPLGLLLLLIILGALFGWFH